MIDLNLLLLLSLYYIGLGLFVLLSIEGMIRLSLSNPDIRREMMSDSLDRRAIRTYLVTTRRHPILYIVIATIGWPVGLFNKKA